MDYPQIRTLLEKAARVRASAPRDEKLRRWSKPPSDTEIEKCDRSTRMVRQAIAEDPKLSAMEISVYAKGSYANRTNIPSDSDVDVAVVATGYYFNDYPAGMSNSDFNFVTASYSFAQFKADVEQAVRNKFGHLGVSNGKKCIQVHSNSCRVDADVVPHFVHRRYQDGQNYIEGVALKDSAGNIIKNWPSQDYENGVAKNEKTARQYKALVRTLKSIRSEMGDSGYTSAAAAPSYLLACLAWNVPDMMYEEDDYETLVVAAIDYLVERTSDAANVKEWGEVNELKYLFRPSQPWKLDKVNEFLKDAKTFVEDL